MKQRTLAMMTGFGRYTKKTKRALLLEEMEQVVPWRVLNALIEPHYPKVGNGQPPVGVERMLRIYFLQQWFNLSDPGVEEALYDSVVLRQFAGIDPGQEPVPDAAVLPELLHGEETRVWGDQAYRGQTEGIQQCAPRAQDCTHRRHRYKDRTDEVERAKNRTKSRVGARSNTCSKF
jgi:transposase, IS5 family